jgi:cephalosporin hydroxylase
MLTIPAVICRVAIGCLIVFFPGRCLLAVDAPPDLNRPSVGQTNNLKTTVWEFMMRNDRFEIDKSLEAKLVVTVARDGYLRCVKDGLLK